MAARTFEECLTHIKTLEKRIDNGSRLTHEWKRKYESALKEIDRLQKIIEELQRVIDAFHNSSLYQEGWNDAAKQLQATIEELKKELEAERDRHQRDLNRTREIHKDALKRVAKKEKERYDRNLKHAKDSHHNREIELLEKLKRRIDSLQKKNAENAALKEELAACRQKIKETSAAAVSTPSPAPDKTTKLLRQKDEEIARIAEELALKERQLSKMKAQINKNSSNSSIPSSQNPNHKTIHNSRVKSGRKPGAQADHDGHGRHDLPADCTIVLEIPQEVARNPEKFTQLDGRKSRKGVSAALALSVVEYVQPSWKNNETGEIVKADFPEWCVNEINYEPSVKALLCLLTNTCHVSIRKSQELLKVISNNQLNIATGTICNLAHEFSVKSDQEQKEIAKILRDGAWMHIDTTYIRAGGSTGFVDICTNPQAVQYTYGRHKGKELADKTAVKDYDGIVIHDREATFFNYGSKHQICHSHLARDFKGVMENEADYTWPKLMYDFISEIDQKANVSTFIPRGIDKVMARFDEILDIARKEYGDKKFVSGIDYVDGKNLFESLEKLRESVFTFLKTPGMPCHNNHAEQKAREMKRKTKQSDGFRSEVRAQEVCDVKSVLQTEKMNGRNMYDKAVEVYGRRGQMKEGHKNTV